MVAPSLWTHIRRGLALRCPACGEGRLFKSYLKPVEKCTGCSLVLHQAAGADGPSYFVMFLVIIVVPVAALLVEAKYTLSLWTHMILWIPSTLILSLGLLPYFKGVFVALEYHNRTDFFETSSSADE